MSTEELEKDPINTLNTMFKFLDLSKYEVQDLKKRNKATYPMMKEGTREILIEFFKEHNEKLFKLIGKEFEWNK